MACYPCTLCNRCGKLDARPASTVVLVCNQCGTEIPVGQRACPACGCEKSKVIFS